MPHAEEKVDGQIGTPPLTPDTLGLAKFQQRWGETSLYSERYSSNFLKNIITLLILIVISCIVVCVCFGTQGIQ